MHYRFSICAVCGAPGHNAKSPRCPYRTSQEKMERQPKRVARVEIESDPALREATTKTMFLGQAR